MSLTIRTRHIVVGVILCLLLTLGLGWWLGYSRQKKVAEIALKEAKNELQTLTVQLNDKEYSLTKIEQELATERELRKQDVIDKETLRKLNIKHVNEISKLKLRIDTLLEDVGHTGQIITIRDTINQLPSNALLLPFGFQKKDEFIDLKGKFDRVGRLDIDLSMDISVDAISGFEKKTGKPTLSLLTDNKYIDVIDIKSYKTDVPRPKKYGAGIFCGYGINTKNPQEPSIVLGVGVSYNLISF